MFTVNRLKSDFYVVSSALRMWLEKGRISRQAFHILGDELAGSCCSAAGQIFILKRT